MRPVQQRQPVARRLFDLTEPVSLVAFFSEEPHESMKRLGLRTFWDGYFAGRAARPSAGRSGARGLLQLRRRGGGATHPRGLGDHHARGSARRVAAGLRRGAAAPSSGTPGFAQAADLLVRASTSAPTEGRVVYAGLRSLPVPEEPVARLWHAATMLREHRGDGHVVALVAERIGGTESHVLSALAEAPYDALDPSELDELIASLEPLAARLQAAGSR